MERVKVNWKAVVEFVTTTDLTPRIKKGGSAGEESNPFQFSWYDVYSGTIYQIEDIDFEMASVLFNIGALHTHLGAAESRTTSESMKVACTHFQCAAWAFHTLPDRYCFDMKIFEVAKV